MSKGTLRSVVCQAVWPQTRLHDAGYDVCRLCPLCKQAEDKIHHRVWECSHSAEERSKHACAQLIREARVAGPSSALFSRALGEHLADGRPGSLGSGGVTIERFDQQSEQQGMQGDIYVDGSCTRHIAPELQRVGWAVVQLGADGDIVARA